MRPLAGKLDPHDTIQSSLLDSFVYKLLIATCRKQSIFGVRQWWGKTYALFAKRGRTVSFTMHDHNVVGIFGNTYPLTTRVYPSFNGPLLELVRESYQAKEHPVRLLDVGASIGDTVLLVDANCQGMISEYVCVEGNPDFFDYLEHNLSFLSNARTIIAQLSRSTGNSPSLVRINPGAASAVGATQVKTSPLDLVLESHGIGPIDVLKIDVDGFDGEVLAGATRILNNDRPSVIFEWHPIWCQRTENSWAQAFESLTEAGYTRFIWFNKFGFFSHFMYQFDRTTIDALAQHCLADIPADLHYDVIAIHDSSAIDIQALSALTFSRNRISQS